MTSKRVWLTALATSVAFLPAAVVAQETPLATEDRQAPDAAAQSANSQENPEIVVTAQRRAQNLQDVPISLTAFTEAEVEGRGANNVSDIIGFAPNVASTAGPNGGDDGGFFIRGVGQLDNSITVDPGVGVYVDEVYIARLQASSIDLDDVQRVEVLRGPQGTLFGRNTIGGAVSVITHAPTFGETSGRVRAIYGSRDRMELSGSLNLPLGDSAALRASAYVRTQDGYGVNVYTGATYGDVEDYGGRLRLRFKAGERLEINLSGDLGVGRGSPSHQVLLAYDPMAGITIPVPPPGQPFFLPGVSPTGVPLPPDAGADRSNDRSRNFVSTPPINDIDSGGVSMNVRAELSENLLLRSITAWRKYKEDTFNDFDASGYALYDTFNALEQEQFSQELQLAGQLGTSVQFLLGGYYFEEKIFNRIDLCTGTNQPRLISRCLRSVNDIWLDVESIALFGQGSVKLTEAIELFAGARWTTETKTQSFMSVLDNSDGVRSLLPPFIMPAPGASIVALPFSTVEDTFEAFSPKVGINAEVARGIRLYASYSEGFKSGGFTGRPSNSQIEAYDPEKVQSYEAGFKTDLFGRRLRLNGAAFHSKYTDIQLLVFNPANGLFETRNAGDAEINGFELEADARLGARFNVYGGLGYLDAGYTRLSPTVLGITLDTPLPLTPKWTYSLGAQYRIPLGSERGELALRADYNYRGRVSYQLEADPLEIQDGYGLLNLRATYALPGDALEISVFGTNVTGEDYFTSAQSTLIGTGTAFASVGDPAEWGVEASLRF